MIVVLTSSNNFYKTNATELNRHHTTFVQGWFCNMGVHNVFINTKKAAVNDVMIRNTVCKNEGNICKQKLCWCPADIAIPKAIDTDTLARLYKAPINLKSFNFNEEVIAFGSEEFLRGNVLDIDWTIIKQCNYDCSYCPSHIHDNIARYSSFEDSVKYIEPFMDTDKDIKITISGGEPLLHPEIEQFLQYSSNKGKTTVLTNGTANIEKLLNLEQYCKFLITLHHEYVTEKFVDKIIGFLQQSKRTDHEVQLMDLFPKDKYAKQLKQIANLRENKPIVNKNLNEYEWI